MPLTQPPWDIRLAAYFDENAGIRTFRFAPEPARELSFTPGQFVMLNFPEDAKLARAFSIASSPLEHGYFEVTLSRVAAFTQRMFELKTGERMQARGPFGKWQYRDSDRHAVLISGGTGITPFRSMLRYVLGKGLSNKLTIICSTRTPADLIYGKELAEAAARNPNIKVYHTVTRPQEMKAGETWEGATGRLDLEVVKKVTPDFKDCSFYLCGPNQLVKALDEGLLSEGISKEAIRYEKWGEY